MPADKMASELSSTFAFNETRIVEQWGSLNDDIYLTILGIFANEGTKLCADARASLATGQRDALVRAAHTLAGASANVGALHLAACAKALQASAEAGLDREIEPLVTQVEAAWRSVRRQIARGGPTSHG
jgi:HPt (histidine-containing phosphotransfer) domain-containing protein